VSAVPEFLQQGYDPTPELVASEPHERLRERDIFRSTAALAGTSQLLIGGRDVAIWWDGCRLFRGSMKFRTSLLAARLLMFPTNRMAAQEQAVLGQGNVSCGTWLEPQRWRRSISGRVAWILGYITAFNQYGSKPEGDVTGGKETEQIMAWIDNHCRRHPTDNLHRASAALVDELRQKIERW